ncbi:MULTISPECIES: hypothetical protein [unclassified Nonomuraea]
MLDGDGKQKSAKAHYAGDQINDATLMSKLEHDLKLIFPHLA